MKIARCDKCGKEITVYSYSNETPVIDISVRGRTFTYMVDLCGECNRELYMLATDFHRKYKEEASGNDSDNQER